MKTLVKGLPKKEYTRLWRKNNKEHLKEYNKRWREENKEEFLERRRVYRASRKEQINEYRRGYIRKIREEVVVHYGGKCACCGEKEFVFLAIDHVNGGGSKHRKEVGAYSIPSWLKKNGYPKDYQILCHNCNQAKSIKGVCPHKFYLKVNK